MAYSEILYDVSDRIATLTLNRPEKLNAWTNQMGVEVRAALLAAEEDADVRIIIITGAGRGFCAGADMGLLQSAAASGVDRPILPPQPEPKRTAPIFYFRTQAFSGATATFLLSRSRSLRPSTARARGWGLCSLYIVICASPPTRRAWERPSPAAA
jgi:hypothetical protein